MNNGIMVEGVLNILRMRFGGDGSLESISDLTSLVSSDCLRFGYSFTALELIPRLLHRRSSIAYNAYHCQQA